MDNLVAAAGRNGTLEDFKKEMKIFNSLNKNQKWRVFVSLLSRRCRITKKLKYFIKKVDINRLRLQTNNSTVLHVLLEEECENPKIYELMIKNGANPKSKDAHGKDFYDELTDYHTTYIPDIFTYQRLYDHFILPKRKMIQRQYPLLEHTPEKIANVRAYYTFKQKQKVLPGISKNILDFLAFGKKTKTIKRKPRKTTKPKTTKRKPKTTKRKPRRTTKRKTVIAPKTLSGKGGGGLCGIKRNGKWMTSRVRKHKPSKGYACRFYGKLYKINKLPPLGGKAIKIKMTRVK